MSTKDEAERLAKEHGNLIQRLRFMRNPPKDSEVGIYAALDFKTGFLAGEKSERVQRLIEFVKANTSCDIRFGTVSGTFNTPSTHSPTCKKCLVLASFNASPEEKK